ncbi:dnaJ homolog subfamily C member 8-like [Sycon ciliatum]|uniref:dnaJ homolog subfamily C member 8-like n=1 Tax=Sycon ciliatum TaxID=27933 RepID=UPI0031F61054
MATSGEPKSDEALKDFFTEVKEIEKRDSVLTSDQQIARLTRPGSSYFNLNPFEVLQIDKDSTETVVKKTYRKLSILVHPDKNPDCIETAQKAFEAVKKAYETLLDEEQKKACLEVYVEAEGFLKTEIQKKKKKLKKEGKDDRVEEDDPRVYEEAFHKRVMTLFADFQQRRKEKAMMEMNERKRQRQKEIEEEEAKKAKVEYEKGWEESRTKRVDSWRDWQTGAKKKKKKDKDKDKIPKGPLRPPKLIPEKR